MAIPAKGSRKIIVDDEAYKWLIRRKATHLQTDYGIGKISVAIQHATRTGSTLIVLTDCPHPKDWATEAVDPITPKDVAEWIQAAKRKGWAPDKPRAQFILELDKKC